MWVTLSAKVLKALYKPAGCLVQVLIVRESTDCFMCTDLAASAVQILEAVAHRYAIEQNFSDLKEIEGAGQQQVRTLGSNIGVFHLNVWLHSMVELWAWDKSAKALCDRSDSRWYDIYRRPSHADKCAALRREVLKQTFFVSSGKNLREDGQQVHIHTRYHNNSNSNSTNPSIQDHKSQDVCSLSRNHYTNMGASLPLFRN